MRIALIGYGKMGHMIEQIALKRDHKVVSIIDVDNIEDSDSPVFVSTDIAIKFTNPTAAFVNYQRVLVYNVKVASGSTGQMQDHKAEVGRMCTESGQALFWANNFSIGAAIFSTVNRYSTKIMNGSPRYNVRMEEVHHVYKLNAPPGTTITLAEEIIKDLDRKGKWVKGFQHAANSMESGSNKVAPSELPIASIRRDEVPDIHSISYDSEAGKTTIIYSAHSRKSFALGAVLAVEYTRGHTGLLTISNLFKL